MAADEKSVNELEMLPDDSFSDNLDSFANRQPNPRRTSNLIDFFASPAAPPPPSQSLATERAAPTLLDRSVTRTRRSIVSLVREQYELESSVASKISFSHQPPEMDELQSDVLEEDRDDTKTPVPDEEASEKVDCGTSTGDSNEEQQCEGPPAIASEDAVDGAPEGDENELVAMCRELLKEREELNTRIAYLEASLTSEQTNSQSLEVALARKEQSFAEWRSFLGTEAVVEDGEEDPTAFAQDPDLLSVKYSQLRRDYSILKETEASLQQNRTETEAVLKEIRNSFSELQVSLEKETQKYLETKEHLDRARNEAENAKKDSSDYEWLLEEERKKNKKTVLELRQRLEELEADAENRSRDMRKNINENECQTEERLARDALCSPIPVPCSFGSVQTSPPPSHQMEVQTDPSSPPPSVQMEVQTDPTSPPPPSVQMEVQTDPTSPPPPSVQMEVQTDPTSPPPPSVQMGIQTDLTPPSLMLTDSQLARFQLAFEDGLNGGEALVLEKLQLLEELEARVERLVSMCNRATQHLCVLLDGKRTCDCSDRLQLLDEELASEKGRNQALVEEVEALEKGLQEKTEGLEKEAERVESLEEAVARLQEECDAADETEMNLIDKLAEIQALSTQQSAQIALLEQDSSEVDALRRRVEELEKALEAEKAAVGEVSKLRATQDEIRLASVENAHREEQRKLKQEVVNLRQDVALKESKIQKLKDQLRETQDLQRECTVQMKQAQAAAQSRPVSTAAAPGSYTDAYLLQQERHKSFAAERRVKQLEQRLAQLEKGIEREQTKTRSLSESVEIHRNKEEQKENSAPAEETSKGSAPTATSAKATDCPTPNTRLKRFAHSKAADSPGQCRNQ